MRLATRKTTAVLITLFSFSLLSGCTDWKAEYNNLYVKNADISLRFHLPLIDYVSLDRGATIEYTNI